MARRGWGAADLARQAQLSQATVSAALGGKPIASNSLALIAAALTRVPPIEAIDSLLMVNREFGLD
jgi:lambda repressor-like predicted transcriptional regulator